jgi:hypothetical protein
LVAQPLWNKQIDKTDHSVAPYKRDHGYDLSYNLRTNWATLGPKLRACVRMQSEACTRLSYEIHFFVEGESTLEV